MAGWLGALLFVEKVCVQITEAISFKRSQITVYRGRRSRAVFSLRNFASSCGLGFLTLVHASDQCIQAPFETRTQTSPLMFNMS